MTYGVTVPLEESYHTYQTRQDTRFTFDWQTAGGSAANAVTGACFDVETGATGTGEISKLL
jgi:hypothetical protein